MKTILLWDLRFPANKPVRLTLDDAVASAAVRSGAAAAADPAQSGALNAGGALDPGMLTEVVLQHGVNGTAMSRVFLPYSVVLVGAAAGVLASIGTPIASTPAPTPTVTISGAQSKPEGNSGATLYTYTVTRSTAIGAVLVPWSFTAGGTDATDYTGGTLPAGGNVSMADGVATGTIVISVNGDTVVEGDETFTVLISTPSGYVAGAATSATGTVLNDDVAVPALPRLSAGIARVRAGTGRSVVAMVGDSLTDGWGSAATTGTGSGSNPGKSPNFLRSNSYPSQMAALYSAAGTPSRADAFFTGQAYNSTMSDLAYAYPNTTFGADWSISSSLFTLGGSMMVCSSTSTTAATYQPLFSADSFDILVPGLASYGIMTVTDVDSGTVLATIDQSVLTGGVTQGSGAARMVRVTRTAHSTGALSFSRAFGGAVYLIGIIPFDSTSPRLEFLNFGFPGSTTANWTATTSAWSPFICLGLFASYVDAWQIELGANDSVAAVSSTTYQTNLQNIANKIKTYGDGMMAKTNPASSGSYNVSAAYLAAVDAVQATINSNAAIDFNSTTYVAADRFDAIHLTQQGYAKKAAGDKAYIDAKV
jgi:hypothetical protein